MYNQELEKLRDKIQSVKLELDRLQRQHHDLTGIAFVISGPRPPAKIETRDCIYINYTEPEPRGMHTPSESSWIEFEGEGAGGLAVAEYLNHGAQAYDRYFTDHVIEAYETAMSREAEDIAAERTDWEYEQVKDRRMFPPLHEANFKGE